ncbi:MAG: hypothetical protein NT145_04065 [Elusimicrobia bacterium]|nr:hypothetical protein [Elusimicrobiota bacterium]
MSESPNKGNMELFIIYGIIALVVLGIFFMRRSWQPFLNKLFTLAPNAPATIVYDWRKVDVGNTGVSIDSPAELKPRVITLPANVKPLVEEMVTFGFTSQPLNIEVVSVLYTPQVVPNINGAEQGAISNLKRLPLVKKVEYVSKQFSASGKKGILLDGTFEALRNKMGFKGVILIEGSNMWQVVTIYKFSDKQAVEAVQRIIDSIKIEKKTS